MCYDPILPNLDLPRPPGVCVCTEVGGRQQWSYLAGGGDSEADWGQVPAGGGAHVEGEGCKKGGMRMRKAPRYFSSSPISSSGTSPTKHIF